MNRLLIALLGAGFFMSAPAFAASSKSGWTCKVTAMGVEMSRPMVMSKVPPAEEEMFRDKAAAVTGAPLFILKTSFIGSQPTESIYVRQADFKYMIDGKKTDPGGYYVRFYDGDKIQTNDVSRLMKAGKETENFLLIGSQTFGEKTAFNTMMTALKSSKPATLPFQLSGKAEWFKNIYMEVPVAGFAEMYNKASARALKEKAIDYVPC